MIKKVWFNPSSKHLCCLRPNIKLGRRGVGSVLYGTGEALQRRPHFLKGQPFFYGKIGSRRTAEKVYIGTHGMEWHEQGERLSEFIMSTHSIHGNSKQYSTVQNAVMSYVHRFEGSLLPSRQKGSLKPWVERGVWQGETFLPKLLSAAFENIMRHLEWEDNALAMCILGREVTMMNDLAPELCRRKRAAWVH
ncbi:hypothetical protein V3C99_018434 [Haemonchus contortus]|uniref:Transposase n=1 Tax=Haemonchus contortus TaxID=6289 RepID=A0A7I4Z4Y5_HAECO